MKPRTAPCRLGGVEMDLPLERGLKIPPIDYTARGVSNRAVKTSRLGNKWPWKHMRNHESVLIPWGLVSSGSVLKSACEHGRYNTGVKFVFRSFDDGMRVWRKDSVSRPK